MADASKSFNVRRVSVTSGAFSEVVAPIECRKIVIENTDSSNPMALRTDKDDPGTEKSIQATWETIIEHTNPCYRTGSVVCYLKSTSASATAVVSFYR